MRAFTDEAGNAWVATAREEPTPRHHGRWQLVLFARERPDRELSLPEVRWQSLRSAERTLATMSVFELRRRLRILLERQAAEVASAQASGGLPASVA